MEKLKEHFENQLKEQEAKKFNIFSALHDGHDETRLHSRFIAFLLTATEQHGFNNRFFKLFIKEVLNIELSAESYRIKREFHNIDIIIYNDKDAIIIENKIYAGDSNHSDELNNVSKSKNIDGYKGQLERYYNTISTGDNKVGKIDFKRDVIQVVYLTLNGHSPNPESLGNVPLKKLKLIEYNKDIKHWLTLCAKEAELESPFLSQSILQYRDLVTKLTSDVSIAKDNQRVISDQIDEAWNLEVGEQYFTKKAVKIFNHVKWHTIADFFNELKDALSIIKVYQITATPEVKDITKVAHNKGNSTTKLGIGFILNCVDLQVVNDSKGFTLCDLTNQKWGPIAKEIGNIKFNDFSKKETFYVINAEKRKEEISTLVNAIEKCYKELPYLLP
ncbi:PDDEXK-like family protein [Sphingobacterium sp. MYb388]|uniref:PDDEXK-like family protein n=1 Tax=Sphingobacterium sp. MYb388 TaxID=2745437 RepID=UPI0030D77381